MVRHGGGEERSEEEVEAVQEWTPLPLFSRHYPCHSHWNLNKPWIE